MGFLATIFNLFNPLAPLVKEVTAAYRAREEAKTDSDRIAAEERLGWAKAQAEVQISAMQHDHIFSPRNIIAYSVAIFIVKLIVWDTTFGLGVTPNPGSIVNWIVVEVVAALYVSKTASAVAGSLASAMIRRG